MEDWRLNNQEKYLCNKTLIKMCFIPADEMNDHTHCAFCWDKFSESPEDLHVGYTTLDGYYWICETCFNDFRERFGWILKQEIKTEDDFIS